MVDRPTSLSLRLVFMAVSLDPVAGGCVGDGHREDCDRGGRSDELELEVGVHGVFFDAGPGAVVALELGDERRAWTVLKWRSDGEVPK